MLFLYLEDSVQNLACLVQFLTYYLAKYFYTNKGDPQHLFQNTQGHYPQLHCHKLMCYMGSTVQYKFHYQDVRMHIHYQKFHPLSQMHKLHSRRYYKQLSMNPWILLSRSNKCRSKKNFWLIGFLHLHHQYHKFEYHFLS